MIPHNRPTLGKEEEEAAVRVIRSGWVAQGRETLAFEAEFAGWHGMDGAHAVAVSSGTAALFIAMRTFGIAGKRVAHPVYVCSAVRHAIRLAGGMPIAIDNSPGSPNVDTAAMAAVRPDLAVLVHTYGLPADPALLDGVPFLEDCAQALGARRQGKPVGLAGIAGIFSFYATKMITTGGQGGMLLSRDRALADSFRDYRQFDVRRDDHDRFNLQMTDLQAAVGRVQLARLPEFMEKREAIFSAYRDAGLKLLDTRPGQVDSPVRYRAVVETRNPGAAIAALERAGASAIVPLEDWELLGPAAGFPHAAALTRSTVSLPVYPTLAAGETAAILAALETL